MDEDIKSNGWGIKKITDVNNAEDFISIFQTFYQLTGRLPLSNGLLVIPDGDPPPGEDRINMKSLYDMFRHTNSHGLVSLPFLGILQYYLEKNDFSLIKKTLTELYGNLSYITLSHARDFDFVALSDLTAKISYLLKAAKRSNIYEREQSDIRNAYRINKDHLFVPKTEDPLDTVIDILDEEVEHKKMTHPYVPPQVLTADVTENETQQVDDDFAKLKADYDQINDAENEHKKQEQITELVDDVIVEDNPFQDLLTEDLWMEDYIFDRDNQDIADVSKDILKGIKESDPYLDLNIPTEAIIEDLLEPSNNEPLDDEEPEVILAEPAVPQPEITIPDTNNVSIDSSPQKSEKYITTQLNNVVKAANKIKEKYKKQQKKSIGQLNKKNNTSANWLKAAGYLDTKDQDSIQYIFNVPPKNNENNNLATEPVDDVIDLKKTSGTTATQLVAKNLVRKYRNLAKKKTI